MHSEVCSLTFVKKIVLHLCRMRTCSDRKQSSLSLPPVMRAALHDPILCNGVQYLIRNGAEASTMRAGCMTGTSTHRVATALLGTDTCAESSMVTLGSV